MSVTTTNTSVSYIGTGSVGPFPFNFPISTPAALEVIVNGAVLPSTSYSIAPVNNNYDNGGLVTLNVGAPAGATILLQRNTPLTQTSIFYDNLPLPLNTFENGLDKLTEIVQEFYALLLLPFSGIPSGTINGSNTVFIMVNGSIPLTALPAFAIVWVNYPLVQGVGYSLSLVSGQVKITFAYPPQVGDSLFAQGFL